MLSLVLFATADIQYYNDPDWRAKKKAKTIHSKTDVVVLTKFESNCK